MTLLKGVFGATMSILNNDLSLDIDSTISHATENLDKNGVGSAFLGSTGSSQLLPISEKKKLIKKLAKIKFKEEILIGMGCNSLKENINLMHHSIENNFEKFLVMNPAFYKNEDVGVYDFYSNIIRAVPKARIVLYNFDKLSGYTFSVNIVKKLVNEFRENVIGCKDSSGNLWDNLKIPNFSMFVGSEIKLLKGLELGSVVGCISATINVTHSLARQVYDDFQNNTKQTVNKKLCAVRKIFDDTGNLISALHSFMSAEDERYKKLLPPLTLLSVEKQKELLDKLKELDFIPKKNITA